MKRLFTVMSFFLVFSLGAQERVFAPFVSRLTAEVKNNLVRLSWVDSPDVKGPVFIYSSESPINPSTMGLSAKKPIQVAYGVQSYIDETDDKTHYYFAAATDEKGKIYYLVIPSNNIVTINMPNFLRRQGGQASTAKVGADFSLRAVVQGESVLVSFTAAGRGNLVLYRSIQPIRKMEDLLYAVIVQAVAVSPFIDYPVPGISYYYAIVPQESLVSGVVKVSPGDNATLTPVTVPLSQYGMSRGSSVLMRPIPLPLISLSALIDNNSSFNTLPQELSLAAEQALMDVERPEVRVVTKKPRAFKEDMETPVNGEEYTLRYIMQTFFAKREWTATREQLALFLSLPRSADTTARTRFYLGQVYYFLNMPRESLFEFLMIKTEYPQEAAEWISAVLDMLIK